MSPSSNMVGCVPESTTRRERMKATAEKMNGIVAVSRSPFLFRGTSIFIVLAVVEKLDML